jgi:hypothetical protein
MADVTKIPGPVPNEPTRESREAGKPSKSFADTMKKVGKSGEREKKKQKRQQESEDETKAELSTTGATPDKHVESTKKTEGYKIQKVGESEKRQSMAQKRAEESAAAEETAAASVNRQKIESINLDQVNSATVEKKGATPSYTGEIPQQEKAEETVSAVEKKEEETIAIRRKEKKERAEQQGSPVSTPASSTLGPLFIAPPPQVAPAYTLLNGEMLAIFEKMVSQIFIMQANGLNETTIHLNTPEFASSIFSGAQIVIREYSTAPLSFNIEFLGTDQNSLYFQQNIASLRAAFASEKRNYSIHRIDSGLQRKGEKPLFHRKEKTSDKEKEGSR